MRLAISRSTIVLGCGACLLALAAGCGSSSGYSASEQDARQALESALTSWREGKKPEMLVDQTPPIHYFDYQRQGKALESYEIVGEEPGGPEKRFKVKLKLKQPASQKETSYVVLGKSPLMVYHEDDYTSTLNMGNDIGPRKHECDEKTKCQSGMEAVFASIPRSFGRAESESPGS